MLIGKNLAQKQLSTGGISVIAKLAYKEDVTGQDFAKSTAEGIIGQTASSVVQTKITNNETVNKVVRFDVTFLAGFLLKSLGVDSNNQEGE